MKNGSWYGVMGLMARKEVDVTSVELTMERMRSEVVDYIVPLINDRYCVLFVLLYSFWKHCDSARYPQLGRPRVPAFDNSLYTGGPYSS